MNRIPSILLLVTMCLACGWPLSCGEDDDNSENSNNVEADDDNDVDMDDDNNDEADDDDGADDDTSGDDDSSPPTPFRLLIIGMDGNGLKSWEQTDDGWRGLEVPAAAAPEPDAIRAFGPVLILEGQYGYSAINYFTETAKRGYSYYESLGHAWMDFDAETGWWLNDDRPSAGENTNIMHLQAPGDGSLWTAAQYILMWSDSGVGPGPHNYYHTVDDLFHFGAQQVLNPLSLVNQSILALTVPSPDFGLAWVESAVGTEKLLSYDGQKWSVAEKPLVMNGGEIDWFWLTDLHHGYAVLSKGFRDNYLLETDGEKWEMIPAPTGCEAVDPSMVFATGDYAIVIDSTRRTTGFWELRDGAWSCRTADLLGDGGFWEHALATSDGRAYAVINEGNYEPCLIEITAEAISRIELPTDLTDLKSVHALGDDAPPISYSPF